MEQIDIRLNAKEIDLLKSMIGHQMNAIYHDAFIFTNSTSQILQIETDDKIAYLYSFVEPREYYGSIEDVAVWTFETERYPAVNSKEFIKTPIQERVIQIDVVQENQKLFKFNKQTHDVWLTRGLIFKLESGREISFEKDIWFSEDIEIQRGYDLLNTFASTKRFEENSWEEGCKAECSRVIETIK